jgi:hypothetical protein
LRSGAKEGQTRAIKKETKEEKKEETKEEKNVHVFKIKNGLGKAPARPARPGPPGPF